MSLINDALKRANQFPQPPVVVGEETTFRHVEYAPKPKFSWTTVVVVLAVLWPLAWLVYRSKEAASRVVSERLPIVANARETPNQPGPPDLSQSVPLVRAPRAAQVLDRSDLAALAHVEKPAAGNEPPPLPTGTRTHTIKAGDTPSSVARQYGIKLQALMEANPTVNARKLKVGQPLIIPSC